MADKVRIGDKYHAIQDRIRETPLLERLDKAQTMIGKMCSEGRPPKMTIPVQPTDEDVFITTTLRDAMEAIQNGR